MQVEIALPNRDGTLLPGAYVQVALPLPASGALTMPTNALLFRGEGTRVAVVDAQGKVRLRPVRRRPQLRRDRRGARRRQPIRPLVLNPPDSLADGERVAVAPTRRRRRRAGQQGRAARTP